MVMDEREEGRRPVRSDGPDLGQNALNDLAAGFSRRWLWGTLGWNDIRQRYSGSVLGSFWITASTGLLVACLTLIFAAPLGSTPALYAPFVAVGLVLWHVIQLSLNEAAGVFVVTGDTIRHLPIPLSAQVFRLVWRNAIVLAHNSVLIPIVFVLCRVEMHATAWLAVPGLLLLLLNIAATTMLLGLLGARFRDVGQIVGNLTQLLFFATPIFWLPSILGADRAWAVALNPVFAFIDIVRAPLIGTWPAPWSWPLAASVTAITVAAALGAFVRFRHRLAYWV